MKIKVFSKLVALVLAVLMVTAMLPITAAAAPAATIAVSSQTAAAGSTVNVTINMQNNPGITSATLTVTYPAALTLTNVTDGGKLGANVHKPTYSNPYTLCWANDTATENFTANGTVATLTFKVPAGAAVGTKYPITVSYDYDNYEIMDKDSNPIQFTVTAGGITVAAPTTTTKRPTTTTKKPVATTKAPVATTTMADTTTTVEETTTTVADVVTTQAAATTTATAVSAGVNTTAPTQKTEGDNSGLLWWIFGFVTGIAATTVVFLLLNRRKQQVTE